ncbi:MAG: type II toxin-antitoxin system MqsA family antitoxin [Proteobacteria bacterium]|nr:type II toxin-antitoxin system MqsA family antitoxin [Pseudomonadota bacterium]
MTVTLNRGSTVIIIKDVPADVCENCGEYYFLSEEVSKKILIRASAAVSADAEVEIIKYAA